MSSATKSSSRFISTAASSSWACAASSAANLSSSTLLRSAALNSSWALAAISAASLSSSALRSASMSCCLALVCTIFRDASRLSSPLAMAAANLSSSNLTSGVRTSPSTISTMPSSSAVFRCSSRNSIASLSPTLKTSCSADTAWMSPGLLNVALCTASSASSRLALAALNDSTNHSSGAFLPPKTISALALTIGLSSPSSSRNLTSWTCLQQRQKGKRVFCHGYENMALC
mmetsp:Transcript_145148/g.267606  ORF Transcript_145148/g.267606 Transcript_145148/m.267606 type:complete len:231 (+) Transcript_145148:769-1461(+)